VNETRRAETAAIALFAVSTVCAAAFVAVYAIDSLPRQTQLLGLSLGLSLLSLAAALIVTGRALVSGRELDESYPPEEHPEDQDALVGAVEEAGAGLTRRRLFTLAFGAAGGALGLALVTPALSLGRFLDTSGYRLTPWRPGRRLVSEDGTPWRAADIEEKNLYTAFPEGGDPAELASPVVLVRLPPGDLRLPSGLRGFAAEGIVAYSKICTHAGCAVALYRSPQFASTDPRPALVCPCHYSTFDPAAGGAVLFGPAGRPLPMLPVRIDGRGFLRARGTFAGEVGPAWWGTRIWGPRS
jgi:ubiquinol-cytochrome c reductase iron-sulfur subunit